MQRSIIRAAGFCLAALFALQAYAGPYDAPAVPKEEGKALKTGQTGTVGEAATGKSGSSVVERDKKRYAIQKRAADRRAAELKKAEQAKKPATSSSVVERDQKRYEARKRAAARRAAEMKKADTAGTQSDVMMTEPSGSQGQAPVK
ncbi:MAG: hypothetical protein A2X58_12080 [Nitrospirae bacterium GWC2_56_14]|nr:MAG: hypothetical protein A2X58_12080 [Nitrospirae bacterium GWC2_56_14]